jgi:hypothetical protein
MSKCGWESGAVDFTKSFGEDAGRKRQLPVLSEGESKCKDARPRPERLLLDLGLTVVLAIELYKFIRFTAS